ncbi:MAG: ATP-binding cassette domain-containing protein [Blautia massiliensis (ex Durand et al. 2017)]
MLLASEFFLPLRLLGSYFHIAMNGMAAGDEIFSDSVDLPEPKSRRGRLPVGWRSGYFFPVNVAFSPQKRLARYLVESILRFLREAVTPLVGESGCGKSTIAGLTLERTEISGEIRIGGEPLEDLREDDLMEHVVLWKKRHNSSSLWRNGP